MDSSSSSSLSSSSSDKPAATTTTRTSTTSSTTTEAVVTATSINKKNRPTTAFHRLRNTFGIALILGALIQLPDVVLRNKERQEYKNNVATINSNIHYVSLNSSIDSGEARSVVIPVQYYNYTSIQFVFVLGLEGTGHHLMTTILAKSPIVLMMERLNLISDMKILFTSLFHPVHGYLNQHCINPPKTTPTRTTAYNRNKFRNDIKNKNNQQHRRNVQSTTTNGTTTAIAISNTTKQVVTTEKIATYFQHIARTLQKELDRRMLPRNGSLLSTTLAPPSFPPGESQPYENLRLRSSRRSHIDLSQQGHVLYVPLNAGGIGLREMASYPQDTGHCRPLRYADLGVLYHLCDAARVDCKHMYLYRDPFQVIQSTTFRRNFNNKDVLLAMHLYTSMLYIMYGEMSSSAGRNRTVACTGFYEPNITSTSDVWTPIRDMFGWSQSASQVVEFHSMIDTLYKPSTPLSKERIESIGFNKKPYYLQSLVQIHQDVIDLCQQQVRTNIKQ